MTHSLIERYSANQPVLALRDPKSEPANDADAFRPDDQTGLWARTSGAAPGEAIVMLTGHLGYSRFLETTAEVGDAHAFRSMFRHARTVLAEADLAVGALLPTVAPMYPTMALMPPNVGHDEYLNASGDYVEALRYAGFDCLALAGRYNASLGARGALATEASVRSNGIATAGLGVDKHPVFDVNGVRIAVLSYTADDPDVDGLLTPEGKGELLSVLSDERVREDIEAVRGRGAQLVIAYIDFSSPRVEHSRSQREAASRLVAEAGADYVVCAAPNVISRVFTHETRDGRGVRVATGLGNFAGRTAADRSATAVALRLVVNATADGAVEVDDSYIPFARMRHFRGSVDGTTPAPAAFHPRTGYDAELFEQHIRTAGKKVGNGISMYDPRKVVDSSYDTPQLTPEEVCRILGVKFSAEDRKRLGAAYSRPLTNVGTRRTDLKKGSAAVLVDFGNNYQRGLIQMDAASAVAAGAAMIIASERQPDLPSLVVPNPKQAFVELVTAIRQKYRPLTVAVTGTAGKTTTKEFITEIFKRQFTTLYAEGNKNTIASAGMIPQLLTPTDEAYVQEVTEGSPGSAHTISRMIRPDIAVITSIGEGHLGQMKTMAAVIEGCTQVVDGLSDDGIVIVNNDNEHLREQTFSVRTVRYGIDDPTCDYWARGVRSDDGLNEFEVVSPDGSAVHVALRFPGTHNVSNALGAYAVAAEAGVPSHKIVAGLARLAPASARQNIMDVGGYKLLVDTYSATPMSVVSAVRTLADLPVRRGGKRVAVVGDIPDLGGATKKIHRDVGEQLGELDFDLLLCCGRHSAQIVEGARSQGKEARFYADRAEFNREIARVIAPGDAVAFKGGTRVRLLEETVRPLFGRIA